jgi:ABC-type lipoprotein export system ATPase subunit
MTVVCLTSVHKRYGQAEPVEVLRGIDLKITTGEFVAIVGPSGSGKSTLLHIMGGLDRPTSGTVEVLGHALPALDDNSLTRLRRDRVGFVFQFFHLMPTMTALENVMLPALLGGKARRELRPRAEAALEAVGLSHRKAHRPDALSGGEMQRVAIARALLLDPPLLLCDEPTGSLDTKGGEEVLSLIAHARTGQRTVVLVTHDPRLAQRADRVVAIRDGLVESEAVRGTAT